MFGIFYVFLNENIVDAESFARFALGIVKLCQEIFFFPHNSHTAAPTAGRRLQHNRITTGSGERNRIFLALNRLVYTGNGTYTRLMRY